MLALAMALAACNPLYGLDPTQLEDIDAQVIIIDRDLDDDGVVDDIDNCVDMFNELQENVDGDALGDVCDPCPTGSNHDEDGDGRLDGCDNCPQVANDDQANTDADDLGDACDPNPEDHDVRERFEAFESLTIDWIPGGVDWVVDNGMAKMTSVPGSGDHGLWNRRIEVVGEKWSIETKFRFDAPVVDSDYASIQSRNSVGAPQFLCYVQNVDGTSWIFAGQSATPQTINVVDNTVRIRMYYTGTQVMCEANGLTSPNVAVVPSARTHPGITANTTKARFEYVDATSTPP